jgi:hypothetical protein
MRDIYLLLAVDVVSYGNNEPCSLFSLSLVSVMNQTMRGTMAASKTEGISLRGGLVWFGKPCAGARTDREKPYSQRVMSLTCARLPKKFTDPGAWQLANYCGLVCLLAR